MPDDKRPYTVTVPIPPVRTETPAERAQRAQERERADYHSAPRKEFDTVNVDRTSWLLSDNLTTEFKDGRGNVAISNINTLTRESSATLRCRDGRQLPEHVASDAMGAVRNGRENAGWFSTDYVFDNQLNPLENACRIDHNNRRHGGREPE